MTPTSQSREERSSTMKNTDYSNEEIARELACYNPTRGINKAGDIMRQLNNRVIELEKERAEWNKIYRPMFGHDWDKRQKTNQGM